PPPRRSAPATPPAPAASRPDAGAAPPPSPPEAARLPTSPPSPGRALAQKIAPAPSLQHPLADRFFQTVAQLRHQPVGQRQVLRRVQRPLARAVLHLQPARAALCRAEH